MAGGRARVFIVESDPKLQHSLASSLTGAGYEVAAVPEEVSIDLVAARFTPDVAIVDVPACAHGFVVVQRLRSAVAAPMLFLTDCPHDTAQERPATNQDECLCKPFSSVEMLASVRRLLCRAGYLGAGAVRVVGDLVLDDALRTAARASNLLELTRKEYDLLSMLARHAGQILTHAQLSSYVWGSHDYGKNLIEVHVSALRRKLEAHGPRLIHTVRNVGYVLRI